MAIYPGAVFKPTSWGGKVARNKQGRGILHVAVSAARSLPPWNGNTWHFYVAADGYCEQYVDTEYRAYGDVDANDDAIVIETAGGLGTSPVLNAEKWTPAQAARIADIMRWEASQPGGAPLQLLPDAKAGRQGWGPHRLGIKHSAGNVPGWWFPGCEVWSSVLGKECPGTAKVNQIPGIIEMARSGSTGDDEMADYAAQLARIEGALIGGNKDGRNNFHWADAQQAARHAALLETIKQLQGGAVNVDLAAIEAAGRRGAESALADLKITIDTDGSPAA